MKYNTAIFDGAKSCKTSLRVLVIIFLGFGWTIGRAQAEPHWMVRAFEYADQDLRTNTVLRDANGRLWWGTERGLYVFDGVTTQRFHAELWIQCLLQVGDTMWVGTEGGGLYSFSIQQGAHEWTNWKRLAAATIQQIQLYGNDQLMIGASNGLFLFKPSNNKIERVLYNPSSEQTGFTRGVQTFEGHPFWITDDQGLVYRKPNETSFTSVASPAGQRFISLLLSKEGQVIVGTDSGEWLVWAHRKVTGKPLFRGSLHDHTAIRKITQDLNGRIWLATNRIGVWVWEDQKTAPIHLDGLPNGAVYDLFTDTFGVTWIATEHGLFKAKEKQQNIKKLGEGVSMQVNGMAPWKQGMLMSTASGIFYSQRNQLTPLRTFDETYSPYIGQLLTDQNGQVWGLDKDNLVKWDESKRVFRVAFPEITTSITQLRKTAGGQVLMVSGDQLGWVPSDENAGIKWNNIPNGFKGYDLSGLVMDKGQRIGLATKEDGLWVGNWGNEASWERLIACGKQVHSLAMGEGQDIWGVTDQGLVWYKIDKGNVSCGIVEIRTSVPQKIKTIFVEKDLVWFTSESVVGYINKSDKLGNNWGRATGLDGYFGDSVFAKDAEGRLLLGGRDGAYVCNLFQHGMYEKDKIKILDYGVPGKAAEWNVVRDKIILDYPFNSLVIRMSSLDYWELADIYIQYRTEGLDKEWIYRYGHMLNIERLPVGEYRLHVRMADSYGVWSAAQAVQLRVLGAWWKSEWALLGYVLVFAGIIFVLWKYKINKIKHEERIQYLEKEKEIAIAKEKIEAEERNKELIMQFRQDVAARIHDHIKGDAAAIMRNCEYLEKTEDFKEKGILKLKNIKLLAQQSYDYSKDLEIIIDDNVEEVDKFFNYMIDVAKRYLDAKLIFNKFVSHPEYKITPILRDKILSFYRLVLGNIGEHADATHVQIELRFVHNKIQIKISDNGKGFAITSNTFGSGLKNMKTHIRAIGGDVQILSSSGNGTCVECLVDVNQVADSFALFSRKSDQKDLSIL